MYAVLNISWRHSFHSFCPSILFYTLLAFYTLRRPTTDTVHWPHHRHSKVVDKSLLTMLLDFTFKTLFFINIFHSGGDSKFLERFEVQNLTAPLLTTHVKIVRKCLKNALQMYIYVYRTQFRNYLKTNLSRYCYEGRKNSKNIHSYSIKRQQRINFIPTI